MTLPSTLRAVLQTLDRRLILSGGLALLAAGVLLGLTFFGPESARVGAAIGLVALLVVLQVVILFFRPADRSALGHARQAFAAGDYAAAALQLEALVRVPSARPAVRALTLLGNTYRQLGRLADSQVQLENALNAAPKNPFALYGLGRTRLAMGEYEMAADLFARALARGAPSNVACDLGFAEYFAGNRDAALRTLQKTTRLLQIEPYRAYLAAVILALLIEAHQPASAALQTTLSNARREIAGRAYWQTEAERHAATPYGQALRALLIDADRILTDQVTEPMHKEILS